MDLILTGGIAAAIGMIVGAMLIWLLMNRRVTAANTSFNEQRERASVLEATLAAERQAHTAAIATIQSSEQRFRDSFANLSSEALKTSTEQLLQLATTRFDLQHQVAKSNLDSLVTPLRESLGRQEQQVLALEQSRQSSYGSIEEQLKRMTIDQKQLQDETAKLVTALRQPSVRGRWGELQLHRVVELAGMQALVDFVEQQTIKDSDGNRQRPDMQIKLPNQRQIIIDSKVPLEAYLNALEASDENIRVEHFRRHASAIRKHVDDMAKRDYQKSIDGAYDFIVLFIPGDVFFQAALAHDTELLEHAFEKSVIIATPTTLIALLKAVALGWREARIAEDAQQIQKLGTDIYERLAAVVRHLGKLGRNLDQSISSYNDAVGSIERRLLPSARRMHELQIGKEDLEDLTTIEKSAQLFQKAEFQET